MDKRTRVNIMKNEQIKNLKEAVPEETRLEVYKETRDYIEERMKMPYAHKESTGLCLLLPKLLWGLDSFLDWSPDGEHWDHDDTTTAFPELTKEIIGDIANTMYNTGSGDNLRVEFLTLWINQLQNKLL